MLAFDLTTKHFDWMTNFIFWTPELPGAGRGSLIYWPLLILQYNHKQSSYKLIKVFPPKHLSRICQPSELLSIKKKESAEEACMSYELYRVLERKHAWYKSCLGF